ncbi:MULTISPECIES: DUF72 domain-containing protein [Chroococcidiopsis]|uniref:DUF72 domain-containing protein n=1 Tax=Chroococcidiopsis thermalis (strain PCC 7203) TaxID=251229 RepID=K9TVV3_CHRTP|nr:MULTISPECIES: DUF72 domain-containing protein [Chroococcidiopsis]AFY86134.1 protein of unknown function DUF72 [Chroococcidiopsis thermalis PCC 7203]PSB43660.1 DUF72 domain-containing protein [Cyanosarcina cf. burmensis CCALA 770]URD50995.1 DUF72 domain-containing protein [Chroococcidiopsis sp. CCNUC1]
MTFHLGCAVWSYKGWVGDFYPTGSRVGEFLGLYSQRLTTVEGNTTFYAIPDADTVARWAAETPPEFKFCLKLPRDITHQGLLEPHIPDALSFIARMQGLGDRLGPIFAQLPPRYSPEAIEDLTIFLNALREKTSLALEVRHPSWFQEPHASQLTTLLKQLGIGRVLLDSRPIYDAPDDPQIHSERRKPKLPVEFRIAAPFSLVRFISHPKWELNQLFLEEWVDFIDRNLSQGTQIYFFIHCPTEERSPHNARSFHQLLTQKGVVVPPLPWNDLQPFPQQLSLF